MQRIVPLQTQERKFQIIKQWKKHKNAELKKENFILTTWKAFCNQSSIHGVHYLTQVSFSYTEKMLWALAIIFATAGMAYSCLLLSDRFRTSMTSTVFESTSYKVSEIPFAAVSLCNNNRLNYNKTNDAIAKFLPNGSKNQTETFVNFMKILQNMEFGSFDELDVIVGKDVSDIDKLNISKVYEFMMHDCDDFFVSCLWRNSPFNCCEWFSKQRTEYGICWSFNSYTNVGSKFVNVSLKFEFCTKKTVDFNYFKRSANFPWRVSNRGPKSALKVKVNTHPETSIDRMGVISSFPGVMAIVQHPYEWPRSGYFIAAGSTVALKIKPTMFSTSDSVRGLTPEDRQCNYDVSSGAAMIIIRN